MAKYTHSRNDLIFARLIASALREDGHQLSEAASSGIALNIAKDIHTCLDLILTEVATGVDLAKYLVRERSTTKVLFMSASASFIGARYNGGSSIAVLRKPFTADKLRRRVRERLYPSTDRIPRLLFHGRHEISFTIWRASCMSCQSVDMIVLALDSRVTEVSLILTPLLLAYSYSMVPWRCVIVRITNGSRTITSVLLTMNLCFLLSSI